ncbi:BEL1-like homeodomain protein 1-like [Trifolium pratense]|uniref:BEL1-like homeodomain protein 1-like n=1 Tax=Trifolium pratense TaxID=57577 RepID=A0A2K3LL49_TRIPR|nr:BEL1-like homeodomain protein 1-like [Trifolium pratense]
MAAYFHGNSEIQSSGGGGGGADGLQTLVLMNPSYMQYSDNSQQQQAQQPTHASAAAGNFVFLNSTTTENNSFSPHAPPSNTQQFVGIPLGNQHQIHAHHHDVVPSLHGFLPHMQYNQWNTIDPNTAARETPRAQQGLNLTLSSQPARFMSFREGAAMSGGSPSTPASGVTTNNNGNSGIQVLSSKYLRAAHELLEEVVNVNVGVELGKKSGGLNKVIGESSGVGSGGDGSTVGGGEGSGKRSTELSTAERQEIQMKKAKLITMLDEWKNCYTYDVSCFH